MLSDKTKKRTVQISLALSFAFFIADYIYKVANDITYLNRDKCIVNRLLPKIGFILFEYFIELTVVVFIGIFIATLLEKYFIKYGKFFPSNVVTAFLYASLLPVCACTAIPLVRTMQEKMNIRTIITFIIAAPLLNPYIVMLSFSVLGSEYGILRIVSSFILAVFAGYVVEFFYKRESFAVSNLRVCEANKCHITNNDLYLKTWAIFRSVVPYLLAGGLIGTTIEVFLPKTNALEPFIDNSLLSNIVLIIFGIPFYFCNGTDVLLLRPLLCSGIYTGTGIAFSLTSTAICITSILMLFKFMGKRLTFILIGHVFVVTLIISQAINLVIKFVGE